MISKIERTTVLLLVFAVVLGIIGPVLPVFSQEEAEEFEPTYGLGDQMLSLNLGLFIPLFFAGGPDGIKDANLTLGGTGHLLWSAFLSNQLALGGEFGGMFAFTPNRNALYMIPLAARVTYFLRAYPYEFPLSVAAGVNFSRFGESFKIDPIVIPGVGFYWNLNTEWAFGLDARYWWVPQIYTGGSEASSEDNRFGNFLATTLSVLYRF